MAAGRGGWGGRGDVVGGGGREEGGEEGGRRRREGREEGGRGCSQRQQRAALCSSRDRGRPYGQLSCRGGGNGRFLLYYYPLEVRKGKYSGLGVFLLQYFPLVKT